MKLSDYALHRIEERQAGDDSLNKQAFHLMSQLSSIFSDGFTPTQCNTERKAESFVSIARQLCQIATDLGAGDEDFVFDGVRDEDMSEDFFSAAHEIMDTFTDNILYKIETERQDGREGESLEPVNVAYGIKVLLNELITFSVRFFNVDICPIMENYRVIEATRKEIDEFHAQITGEALGEQWLATDEFVTAMSDKIQTWFNLKYTAWRNDHPGVFNQTKTPAVTVHRGQDAAGNVVDTAVLFVTEVDTVVGTITAKFMFK